MDQIMCKPCISSRRIERGTDAVTVLRGFVARTEACAACGARAPLLVVTTR